jgi:hypothetical protein
MIVIDRDIEKGYEWQYNISSVAVKAGIMAEYLPHTIIAGKS